MLKILGWTVALVILGFSWTMRASAAERALATATQLVEAFNRHDPAAMATLVAKDFELYYFTDGKAELSASGREDLRKQMAGYFIANPSVRSVIEGSIDGPRFATFRERAITTKNDVERSASSLAVYEVVDGLIQRAWYYPAEAPRELASKTE